ncbi:MAG: SRPBCC domain-containing protein [Pseudomonadales bacterium]|nr:SRPBCC domain-containing protein [Pseudomonadales bacterium]RZV55560.1 MAG: SRPBCC domain-containing protein [Pseudomonadales bacterium]
MSFSLHFKEEIPAPRQLVWDVICDTESYALWNPFIVACESSFEPGTPITMRVKMPPLPVFTQKETIFSNVSGELMEYGINQPFGLLSSVRQHVLTELSADSCRYESFFELRGKLAPMVGFALGKKLERGFAGMTQGIARRSIELHNSNK